MICIKFDRILVFKNLNFGLCGFFRFFEKKLFKNLGFFDAVYQPWHSAVDHNASSTN